MYFVSTKQMFMGLLHVSSCVEHHNMRYQCQHKLTTFKFLSIWINVFNIKYIFKQNSCHKQIFFCQVVSQHVRRACLTGYIIHVHVSYN